MLNEKSLTGKAVVIGAGTMGGGIAAQLANAGWQVTLLDRAGSDPADKKTRNQLAAVGLERVIKNRPPLLFLPEYASRIRVGNTSDDLAALQDADWVVEAVAENMAIKRELLEAVEAQIGPQTLVSTNTSGLSLKEMSAGRSADFQRRFFGTHFLNPPRYLKLLEVILTEQTDRTLAEGFKRFAEQVLGHRVVEARDTPGFISTRIWIEHLLESIRIAVEQGLTVEEADALTGTLLGRPRSATFRMADLVGLDIIAAIAANQHERLPDDPLREHLVLPDVVQRLIADGRLGEKSGAGFYKREGKAILALDLQTLEYRPRQEPDFPETDALLKRPLAERFAAFAAANTTRWGHYVHAILDSLWAYVTFVAPEVAFDVLSVDNVMRWGFQWELGPFEIEDLRSGEGKNYTGSGPERKMRVFDQAELQPVPIDPQYIRLEDLRGKRVLESEVGTLLDLGDGVACLEFHTKMNTFDPVLTQFVTTARERAERDFAALVIGNQGAHFSTGYNLKWFLDRVAESNWNAIETEMEAIQAAFRGLKYAKIPVVAAPFGYTLGAGCECALHSTTIQASPELTMGLPETTVGLLPTGGGVTEVLTRSMAGWDGISDAFPRVERAFDLIVTKGNAGSGAEAQKMGLLRETDSISRNADRLLYDAKQKALALANAGYRPPVQRSIWVLGEEALARLRMPIHWHYRSGAISAHDRLIADKIASILSGEVLHAQEVREEALLRLERSHFMELIREPKTQERMRAVLETGKPLKN
ncbi:MAG TPA: 3-hydroxyacyl-CoA dehydrogenase/enoyl-CoA hydratase family protein [Chthonomonadaceae bacterium]|nr:3-hydroxyacyl-CoA dehydrogenase/enoyl-CoA hydratase family protein [Chthonomonadaceae bacterium]